MSEPNYHTTKFFTEYLLAIEMKKTEILMNKPAWVELSILELSKILIYEFWLDYVKPKRSEKAKLCFIDKASFIVYIKADDIYKDIAENVETIFDISNYELDQPSPKARNRNLTGLMKDELGGKIMTKLVELKAKPHSYLIHDSSEDKKSKKRKNVCHKKKT